MKDNNPYARLYKKLTTKRNNPQGEFVRLRFLKLFMEICSRNPEMKISVLNFFTISEMNIIFILMRKTFNIFCDYFTKNNVFKNKSQLDYFIKKIYLRGKHIKFKNKLMKKQFPHIKKIIILKLYKMRFFSKVKQLEIIRNIIRLNGLSTYFYKMSKIGMKFTNRKEVDESEDYCLKLIQNDV